MGSAKVHTYHYKHVYVCVHVFQKRQKVTFFPYFQNAINLKISFGEMVV